MRNEVVVIREDGPSLEVPAVITRHFQQAALQDPQALGATEVMSFEIRACRNEAGAALRELMGWRMRPRRGRLWHRARVLKFRGGVQSVGKRQRTAALQKYPHWRIDAMG